MPISETLLAPRVRASAGRLARSLATPLVPADYLDLLDPLRSGGSLRAKVVEVRPETRDAVTLVLQPGRGWAGHTPGQYIRIGVDVEGVRHWRAYSLTASPRRDRCISITIKAIDDGTVSNHLVRRARPGMLLQLDQAQGEFVLPAALPNKLLFITAGSGITPVMGMLRHRLTEMNDVVMVHSAPTKDDVIFGGELRRFHSDGKLALTELHTDTDGMLTIDQLKAIAPDWLNREVWACGPVGLLDAIEDSWAADGVAHQVHTERFRPKIVIAGDGGSVSFDRSNVDVDSAAGTPLLDAGEAAGVLMPSGCRMGICFGCVVPMKTGSVRDLRSGAITTADGDEPVLIQTCISAAAGDCHIDL